VSISASLKLAPAPTQNTHTYTQNTHTHLIVCASISASLIGLAPASTLCLRRVRMLMKSDALMTPLILEMEESQTGAEAMSCSHVFSNRRMKTRSRGWSLRGYRQASGQERKSGR